MSKQQNKQLLEKIKPKLKMMCDSVKIAQNQNISHNLPKNTIEIHNKKIAEFEIMHQKAKEVALIHDQFYKDCLKSNEEAQKLNEFYKEKINEEMRLQDENESEERKVIYREEMIISDIKAQLEQNIQSLQKLKEECIGKEKDLNLTEYRLNDICQKKKSYENKLNFVSLELEEKVKQKQNKENEHELINKKCEEAKKQIEVLTKIDSDYIDYLRMLHNDYQESKGNIRVFCRVRPPLAKETNQECAMIEYVNYNTMLMYGPLQKSNTGKQKDTQVCESYKFDRVFTPSETQEDVFKEISQLVQSALDGYKVCIFAYGQTGSGKTYTMEGGDTEESRGLIPRSIEQIFTFKSYLENMGWKFILKVSCCEIYIDQIRDLLQEQDTNATKGDKLIQIDLNQLDEWKKVHALAKAKRAVAETMCNEKSSRSHCIFQINITGQNTHTGAERKGALNLIDLAGSERLSKSKVEDDRKKESISINKSLTALKSVITALVSTNSKPNYIPYRDSVLTYHLQNYLGGDSKTLMFVNISPLINSFSESTCSLKFAIDVNSCYLQSTD